MLDLTHHKGDFLTFASIAVAVCPDLVSDDDKKTLARCEISPGRWVRHPDILNDHSFSRSEISSDGIMGLIFKGLVQDDMEVIDRVASWKRFSKFGIMGSYGPIEYRFIGIPMLIAQCIKNNERFPKIPIWLIERTGCMEGYRAYLTAMYILCDYIAGNSFSTDWVWNERVAEKLFHKNRNDPFFRILWRLLLGMSIPPIVANPYPETGYSEGWGSCPNQLMDELNKYLMTLFRGID